MGAIIEEYYSGLKDRKKDCLEWVSTFNVLFDDKLFKSLSSHQKRYLIERKELYTKLADNLQIEISDYENSYKGELDE